MKCQLTSKENMQWTYIKDDKVEEEHEDVDDKGSNALQLAHNGLGVLQRESQMLPLLHTPPACSAKSESTSHPNLCALTGLVTAKLVIMDMPSGAEGG